SAVIHRSFGGKVCDALYDGVAPGGGTRPVRVSSGSAARARADAGESGRPASRPSVALDAHDVHVGDPHHVTGVRGVDDLAVADVDAVVAQAGVEDDVARPQLVPGDPGGLVPLHLDVVRQGDPHAGPGALHQARAVPAGGAAGSVLIGLGQLVVRGLDHAGVAAVVRVGRGRRVGGDLFEEHLEILELRLDVGLLLLEFREDLVGALLELLEFGHAGLELLDLRE